MTDYGTFEATMTWGSGVEYGHPDGPPTVYQCKFCPFKFEIYSWGIVIPGHNDEDAGIRKMAIHQRECAGLKRALELATE